LKAIKIGYLAILKSLHLLVKALLRMPSNGLVGNSGACKTNHESNLFHCLQNWLVGNSNIHEDFGESNSLQVIKVG
jgi:hypothetical protein